MSEEEKRWNKKDKPTYIMVPRKFMTAIIMAFICLLIGNVASIQWINYVDHRSNQRLCGIIGLSDKASQLNIAPTELQRQAAIEFKKLLSEFDCK